MKRFLNMVADIFYPRCCPVCQKILADQRRMICPECEKELRPIGHPRCYKCGKPIETGEYCRDCQKHRHVYEQVPVHRSKERQRGFNQAAYLAEKLGHYTGISTDVNIVQKVLKTKSQKKLNALQRRKNLEKAFCVTGDVRGKNILVIDDVYTTGSTIDAMAGCLKRKGAGNVYFLTVCIGRR